MLVLIVRVLVYVRGLIRDETKRLRRSNICQTRPGLAVRTADVGQQMSIVDKLKWWRKQGKRWGT